MGEKQIDPRHSAAFQRHPDSTSAPTTSAAVPAVARVRASAPDSAPAPSLADAPPPTPAPVADTDADDDLAVSSDAAEPASAGRAQLLWTIALFLLGAGLCAVSFALYSEFNFLRWTNATPISGTDQWVISDGTGYGTRTIDQFDVIFPHYMSQMSIWIGAIGIATIVVNLFRIAAGSARRH